MEQLFTPWRHAYITANPAAGSGCFFCDAGRHPDDPGGLVVHCGRHHLVMLNLPPYSHDHLMVAPLEHLASPQESSPEAQAEFWPLVLKTQRVLAKAYNPQGFNLGMNLGTPAGAGVPGHFHFHLVPRWAGDTNFMPVLAEAKVIGEHLLTTYDRLKSLV